MKGGNIIDIVTRNPYEIVGEHSRAYHLYYKELQKESSNLFTKKQKKAKIIVNDKGLYYYNKTTIKKYNSTTYKVIQHKTRVRKSDYQKLKGNELYDYKQMQREEIKEIIQNLVKNINKQSTKDDVERSSRRSKAKIREYALCNDFDYFITFTFDPKRHDSEEYDGLIKKVSKWLNNYKNRKCQELKYILIPELHKDGKKYHFHGLIKGIREEDIKEFRLSKKGIMRHNFMPWHKTFGFTSLEAIRDRNKVASYITKYITKEMVVKFGRQRYLASKGLAVAETVFQTDDEDIILQLEYNYENDFCKILYTNKDVVEYIIEWYSETSMAF